MKNCLRKKIFKRDILPNIETVDKSIPRNEFLKAQAEIIWNNIVCY